MDNLTVAAAQQVYVGAWAEVDANDNDNPVTGSELVDQLEADGWTVAFFGSDLEALAHGPLTPGVLEDLVASGKLVLSSTEDEDGKVKKSAYIASGDDDAAVDGEGDGEETTTTATSAEETTATAATEVAPVETLLAGDTEIDLDTFKSGIAGLGGEYGYLALLGDDEAQALFLTFDEDADGKLAEGELDKMFDFLASSAAFIKEFSGNNYEDLDDALRGLLQTGASLQQRFGDNIPPEVNDLLQAYGSDAVNGLKVWTEADLERAERVGAFTYEDGNLEIHWDVVIKDKLLEGDFTDLETFQAACAALGIDARSMSQADWDALAATYQDTGETFGKTEMLAAIADSRVTFTKEEGKIVKLEVASEADAKLNKEAKEKQEQQELQDRYARLESAAAAASALCQLIKNCADQLTRVASA